MHLLLAVLLLLVPLTLYEEQHNQLILGIQLIHHHKLAQIIQMWGLVLITILLDRNLNPTNHNPSPILHLHRLIVQLPHHSQIVLLNLHLLDIHRKIHQLQVMDLRRRNLQHIIPVLMEIMHLLLPWLLGHHHQVAHLANNIPLLDKRHLTLQQPSLLILIHHLNLEALHHLFLQRHLHRRHTNKVHKIILLQVAVIPHMLISKDILQLNILHLRTHMLVRQHLALLLLVLHNHIQDMVSNHLHSSESRSTYLSTNLIYSLVVPT